MAMKTILAVAVGPHKDILFDSQASRARLGGARPYIEGLIDGLASRHRQLGTDYVIDYRERDQQTLASNGTAAGVFKLGSESEDGVVIFAMSTTVVQAAQNATQSIPIVANVSEPQGDKVRQASNICGVSGRRSQTAGECFERFLATVPTLKKVMVLHNPNYGPSNRAWDLVQAAANKRGVSASPVLVKSRADIEKMLAEMEARDIQKPAEIGVQVLPVDFCLGAAPRIIEVAQQQKNLPTFFPVTDWVKQDPPSALGGYGVPQRRCGELMSEHVEQILWRNAAVSGLGHKDAPPDAFEWVASRAAAKALNIVLPSTGLLPRII